MPTSDPRTISIIVHAAIGIKPQSILDLGIGYGKYGALMREYCDWNMYNEKANHIRIIGVEGFEGYRNALWGFYDAVYIRPFDDAATFRNYDLVLLLDSLEHLPKDKGIKLLAELRAHNKAVLVSTPEGEYPQGEYMSNPLEVHQAVWTAKELEHMGGKILYQQECSVALFK